MSKHTVRKSTVNQFQILPTTSVPRSAFKRDHGWKGTLDAGYLVPFYVDEVYPGDSFKLSASILARLATPVVPFMDNVYVDTAFFFVPCRLLWQHWTNFMGEQVNPDDSIDYLVPEDTAPSGGWSAGSLYDYFGLPTGVGGIKASALFRRAYYRIWNEWYRDENLQDSEDDGIEVGDSGQTKDFQLKRRNKFHDYFTSALPWPQKGDAVTLGLTGQQAVSGTDVTFNLDSGAIVNGRYEANQAGGLQVGNLRWVPMRGVNDNIDRPTLTLEAANANFPQLAGLDMADVELHGSMDGLYVNTSSDSALLSINEIREGFQLQKFLEKSARYGSRYTETIRGMFGVISPDARLQRPEYLGGSHSRLFVNAVAQTSASDSTTPQGNLSAYGVASDTLHGFSKSFTEHGVLIGLVNVRADLTYQQGINRMFSRRGRFDYYWPSFAHLGEQAILNKEIYAQGDDNDDKVFGYQERYAELRYYPSVITGKLRSTDAQSLDVWHLAQKFENLPTLSSEFIQEDPPIDRVIAVQDEPAFVMDAFFKITAVRPLPLYGTPGLVDHF